ncbi:MAG: hypothetical protein FJ271_19470 [Planctomycetes bacterium]|nr:hypothetical protein [Planctomycetota bacterium]
MRDLKERFKDPMVALVGTGAAAAVSRAVGVRTSLLGKDEAPQEVVQLSSLDKVASRLSDGK